MCTSGSLPTLCVSSKQSAVPLRGRRPICNARLRTVPATSSPLPNDGLVVSRAPSLSWEEEGVHHHRRESYGYRAVCTALLRFAKYRWPREDVGGPDHSDELPSLHRPGLVGSTRFGHPLSAQSSHDAFISILGGPRHSARHHGHVRPSSQNFTSSRLWRPMPPSLRPTLYDLYARHCCASLFHSRCPLVCTRDSRCARDRKVRFLPPPRDH